MPVTTPATAEKRRQFLAFIEQELAPHPAVQAVVGVGSIATGTARPDSDIDAVIFLDPYDAYIVPAESIWRPADRSYHSIFADDPDLHANGLQLDCARYDLAVWRDPLHVWPEPVCAGLHAGWPAFDRTGAVTALIADRTAYPDDLRQRRLDDAIVGLDLCLNWDEPHNLWIELGAPTALDRLQSAYDALVTALFACNRAWRPFRSREMTHLLSLPWLPDDFAARILPALNAPSLDEAGHAARFDALKSLFDDLLAHLTATGDYPDDVVSHAFIRSHDEPGRAWNMDEWNRKHAERR